MQKASAYAIGYGVTRRRGKHIQTFTQKCSRQFWVKRMPEGERAKLKAERMKLKGKKES
jgi:hypothetical protein